MTYKIKGRGAYYPLVIATQEGWYWDFNRAWARDMAQQIVRDVFGLPYSYRF